MHWTFLNDIEIFVIHYFYWGVQRSLQKYAVEMEVNSMSAGTIVNISAMAKF